MNINYKTAGLGLLLPAALNPALAVTLGVGIIGFGIYRLLGDDEECEKPKALPVKWSGKTGQRAKMYPTLKTGYNNDQETQLFRQVQSYGSA